MTWVHRMSNMSLEGPENQNRAFWTQKGRKTSITSPTSEKSQSYKNKTFKRSILTSPPQNIVNPFKPWDLNSLFVSISEIT